MYQGILIYKKSDALHNRSYIDCYLSKAPLFHLKITLVYQEQLLPAVTEEGFVLYDTQGEKIETDFAINRTRDADLGYHLEAMGILLFNCARVSELGNDKWKMYQFVKKCTTLPGIPTVLLPQDLSDAKVWLGKKEWIIKAVSGHGGSQVFCYPNEEFFSIIKGMADDRAVLQPRVKGIPKDVRVYIVGGKIIAAILRIGEKEGWRSNYSLGGKSMVYDLTEEQKAMVCQLTDRLKLDMAGIDFIIDEDENWYFNEMEDMAGARMLYKNTDIDIVALYLGHIASQIDIWYH